MKVGYTPREAYNMFRSLRREVFDFFDHDNGGVPLTFGVRPESSGLFQPGAIAHCDFSDEPDVRSLWGTEVHEFASGIRFNAHYLPHLYEDEMLIILLHELAHAVAGWCGGDGHGVKWQNMARQLGTIPSPLFIPRNWNDCWPEDHWNHAFAKAQSGPTIDLWAGPNAGSL